MDSQTVQAVSAAVSAAATLAILIATALYVRYTRRLWQETRRAAQLSADQARSIGQQVDLAAREMRFRIRPYVSPRLEPKTVTAGRMDFRFHLANTGSVPARVADIITEAWLNNDPLPQTPGNRKAVIFPGESQQTAWSFVANSDIYTGRALLRVRIRVEYSGPWEGESYASEFVLVWKNEMGMFVNEKADAT